MLQYITVKLQYNFCACGDILIYTAYSSIISAANRGRGSLGILDFKEINELVFFNFSDREFHMLGRMKEKVLIPVFTVLTFGTDMYIR